MVLLSLKHCQDSKKFILCVYKLAGCRSAFQVRLGRGCVYEGPLTILEEPCSACLLMPCGPLRSRAGVSREADATSFQSYFASLSLQRYGGGISERGRQVDDLRYAQPVVLISYKLECMFSLRKPYNKIIVVVMEHLHMALARYHNIQLHGILEKTMEMLPITMILALQRGRKAVALSQKLTWDG
jgi:hypothetical protein